MENRIIFTVGTRDVQIPARNLAKFKGLTFKDETERIKNHSLKNPREDALFIKEYLETEDAIHVGDLLFPIAQSLVNYCLENEVQSPQVILVSTNQQEKTNNQQQRRMDTLYIAELVGIFLKEKIPSSQIQHEYATHNVHRMQDMYDFFKEKLSAHSSSMLASVPHVKYLLMLQGGMDSINTALLLLATENYSQSKFIGKPENTLEATELRFPQTFKQKMYYKTVKPLLENWQFYGLGKVLQEDSTEQLLALYAHSRMILNHEEARQRWGELAKKDGRHRKKIEDIITSIQIKNDPASMARAKITDIYLSGKIAYQNGDTTNLMLRLYIMLENFLTHALIPVFGDSSAYYSVECQQGKKENTKWREKINEFEGLEKYLKDKSPGKKKSWLFVNPSAHIHLEVYRYFAEKEIITQKDLKLVDDLWAALNQLRNIRNDISHEGKSASLTEINKRLRASNKHNFSNVDQLFTGLDKFLEVAGLMHFEDIRKYIEIKAVA